MTVEEIKQAYTMLDVLSMCGLQQPDRKGFIHCPFHKGDREASMKIYERDYNCFGCGSNGDIFTFLQEFYHISFKEAFLMLGGTYEKPSFSSGLAIYKAKKEREMRRKEEEKLQRRKELNNTLISIYRKYMNKSDPLSDVWCDCYNALQYQLYVHEILNEKRAGY